MSLIVSIIVIAIIVYSITKQQSRQKGNRTNQRMWPEAAYYHGLELNPPNDQEVFPSMSGMVDGLPVEVWGGFDEGGHGQVFCRVNYALQLPFRLSIEKGNFKGESVGSSFEIRGLTAPGITASASDSKELRNFLSDQNINILKNCVGSYHSVKVTDEFLVLGAVGINDGMKLYGFIERAAAFAKSLSGGHTVTVPPSELPAIPAVDDSVEIEIPAQEKQPEPELMPSVAAIPEEPAPQEIFIADPSTEETHFPKTESVIPEPQLKPDITEPEPGSEPESPAETQQESVDLSADGLSGVLFSAAFPGEKEKALFQKVIGKTVHWRGILKSVYPYSTDFVFGKGPGAKATFEICEVASGYGMKNKIKATVSFSEEALAILKGQTGKEFAFTGTLLKMEGFSREFLLEKGSLTE